MATPLLGPDGREYEFDGTPAELEHAVSQGFRVVTEAAPATLGEQAKGLANDASDVLDSATSGAVQGATAGLYGAVLGRDQGANEDPEAYKRRREQADQLLRERENQPVAHTIGELGGALLSPLGKVQGAVTKGIGATTALGRIGANVAGGAAVGGLFGAGNTLSDAALGDHDLTAEKLFAGVGMGAVIGGAGAGLGSALDEAISSVVPRAAKALSGDGLQEWANNRALKAAGATKRDLDYLGKEKADEVGQMLLERGHLGKGAEAPTAADVLKSVSAEKEAVGAQIGKVFEDAHAAGAQPAYSKLLKRLDTFEGELSPLQRKAISPELEETRSAVLEYGRRPAGQIDSGFKALNELKKDLQAKAKWGDNVGQEFKGGLKRQLAGIVRDELDTQIVGHMSPGSGPAFQDLKKLFGQLADAERVAEHGVERLGGNASFGLRDLGVGAAAGLGHGNPVTGVVAAIANKVMRERGQAAIARLAHSIAQSPRLSVAAQSFGTKLPAAAPLLGRYAPMLQRAFATSPALALATHMTLAQADPDYAQQAQVAGFLPETPEEHASAMTKAGAIAGVASMLQHNNDELDRKLGRVFKGDGTPRSSGRVLGSQDFGAKRMRRDDASSHRQRMEEIRALASNPELLVERVTANLGGMSDVTPGVAAAVTRTAHTAVAFLAKEAEEPPKGGPLAPDWVHPEQDLHRFAQVLETVQDPMSVLHHAAAGTLTEEQMRALNTVYPLLARQIADRALEQLATATGVPYRARLMLGMLTGTDPDGSMGLVASNQAAIQSASKKPSNAGAPTDSSSSGSSPVTLAQRTALPSQRSELQE